MGRSRLDIGDTLLGYKPLRSQDAFHRSESRFKCFIGPVGSGKTKALCAEAIRVALENPGGTGLLGAPTYPMLRDVTLTTLMSLLEGSGIRYDLNKSAFTIRFLETGATVLFRSLDDHERLRGTNLAWFGIDEITYTSEEAWLRLEARLRDPQAESLMGFGAGTPRGFDWVYERFRAQPIRGYELIEASPYENEHLLTQVPDYYERLKDSYDEQFYQQEALGKFVNLSAGRVYYAFEREGNVGKYKLKEEESIYWSWDFNIHPMSSVICQRAGAALYVLDEIVLSSSSTPEACAEFFHRYGKHRGGVRVYGDASGGQHKTASGVSDYELIRDFLTRNRSLRGEMRVGRSNPPVRDRINVTNGLLKNAQGECRLLIDEKCSGLIKDLEQVSYKANSAQIDKERDPMRTHLSDALGYLLWEEFRLTSKIGEQVTRLM
jgi:hypothetical protein